MASEVSGVCKGKPERYVISREVLFPIEFLRQNVGSVWNLSLFHEPAER